MPERSFMIVKLIQYIRGYVRIRITGYSPERFLNLCSHHQIRLWGLRPCGHAYEMYLSVKSFRKLKPILRKSNMRIKVLERRGSSFFSKPKSKTAGIFYRCDTLSAACISHVTSDPGTSTLAVIILIQMKGCCSFLRQRIFVMEC